MSLMIDIREITIVLGGRGVLDRCNLSVQQGETLAVSGSSGSGKSTLLRAIIGRHQPEQGEVLIDGTPATVDHLKAVRSKLFYLPQDIQPLKDETVRDFLSLPFRLAVNRELRFDSSVAEKHFDTFGLRAGLMGDKLQDLSGGERKRLGLVQALLLKRPIWLLDELTSSVDGRNSALLVDAVLEQKETTIVAVTHDPQFMQRASRCVALENGRVVEEGGTHGRRG